MPLTSPQSECEEPALRLPPEPAASVERVDWQSVTIFITVHAVALIGVSVLGWSWRGAALAAVFYVARMFGITAGFHRYFAHRTYKTGPGMQLALAWLGVRGSQKGPLLGPPRLVPGDRAQRHPERADPGLRALSRAAPARSLPCDSVHRAGARALAGRRCVGAHLGLLRLDHRPVARNVQPELTRPLAGFAALPDPGKQSQQCPGRAAALALYTSGSTGEPKAVLLSHPAILARLQALAAALPMADGELACHRTPPTFLCHRLRQYAGSLACPCQQEHDHRAARRSSGSGEQRPSR